MSHIRLSIEMRIDALSELDAREYAREHGIDTRYAKWHKNAGERMGRLYIVGGTPLPTALARPAGTSNVGEGLPCTA